jgi:hypothetical protein
MNPSQEPSTRESPLTPTVYDPDRFDGSNQPVEHFLLQLKLVFRTTNQYPTDISKSLYLISRLRGQALEWAAPLLEIDNPALEDFKGFCEALVLAYGDPDKTPHAKHQLTSLRQGSDSVRSYGAKFTHLARMLQWGEDVLVHLFFLGLNEDLKFELATKTLPEYLADTIIMASRVEQQLLDRNKYLIPVVSHSPLPSPIHHSRDTRPNPSILKHSNHDLSPGVPPDVWSSLPEKQRRYLTRLALKLCLYCGAPEHQMENCPIKPPPSKEGKGKAQSQK